MAANVPTMEEALTTAREAARQVVVQAGKLAGAGKKAVKATETGDLRTLRQVLAGIVDAADRARQSAEEATGAWAFSGEEVEEAYLADGRYQTELLTAASRDGLGLYPLDGVLACFPSLVRILPKERAVAIDRKPYRFLRPSHLVSHLKAIQAKPARNAASPFLQSLYQAYRLSLAGKKSSSRVARLTDIYKILTLLPGASRDYSAQEFARDLYLLEESRVRETSGGARLRFHASTGTKSTQVLRVVDRHGRERLYYAVEFEEPR
jgi:hypothetical protein